MPSLPLSFPSHYHGNPILLFLVGKAVMREERGDRTGILEMLIKNFYAASQQFLIKVV